MNSKITIIGAGNVGHHIAQQLKKKGHYILQIFSRDLTKASGLARSVNAQAINDWSQLNKDAAFYIIAVKDDGIASVAKELAKIVPDKIVAHTSGATPSTVFEGLFEQYGIFYPLQTLSKAHPADFQTIPFCIDGNTLQAKQQLLDLANSIVPKVYVINDKERQILHVAAVFVNNFTNHLLSIGENICEKEGLSFDILKPLMQETVRKIATARAADLQTGPAIRGDQQTIDRHLDYLGKFPDYQAIYKLLTDKIRK